MMDTKILLQLALKQALFNTHSDFYRLKYGTHYESLLEKQISDIPFLTRSEIEAVPLFRRLFVPRSLVRFIRSTSGSSGKGVVGFAMLEEGPYQDYLRSIGHVAQEGQLSRYFEPYFTAMDIRSHLLFSAGSFVHEARVRSMEGRTFLSGDFTQPKLTARLAREANVDAVVGSPSGLVAFAPHLKALDGCDAVRLVIAVGELATDLQLSQLRELFPHAKIASQYGLTESQGYIGYTCPERMTTDPKAQHPALGSLFIELVDPDTGESLPLVPGAEGEVVVTTHEPQGFPLVRYRTGDMARIREGKCSCPGNPILFECLGRLTLDRVKVPRGVLTVAAIEKAISSLPFPVHEFEAKWDADGELPKLALKLFVHDEHAGREVRGEDLARRVAIAEGVSYQDITAEGSAAPLSVKLVPGDYSAGWEKKKRLR